MKKIMLVLGLCLSIFSLSFGMGEKKEKVAQDTIKVMTFNVRNSKDSTKELDGKNNWPARQNKMISFIKGENLDIFGTQEAFYDQIQFFEKELPEFESVGVGRDDGKTKGEHANIYYRKDKYKFIDGGTFWLSETPEKVASVGWDADLTRIATWVRLEDKKTGKKILVFNSHFDHIGMTAQEKSAELLAKKSIEITGGNNDAVIVMGDLNFERSNTRSYWAFRRNYNDCKMVSEAEPKGVNYTYNGFWKSPVEEIDYIFINNKMKALEYGQFPLIVDGIYLSDHNAVIATLELLEQN
jgi:endonuclease/exonuclease/phosphatase family metal-dependent hydrolase